MEKRKVKLGAAVVAGAAGATAGPIGACAAVAASQFLVDGGYYAADVIRGRFKDEPAPVGVEDRHDRETDVGQPPRPHVSVVS